MFVKIADLIWASIGSRTHKYFLFGFVAVTLKVELGHLVVACIDQSWGIDCNIPLSFLFRFMNRLTIQGYFDF